MPTVDKYTIRIDQRNATNTAYRESFVSGSNLVLLTNCRGDLIGASIVPTASIAISASYAPFQGQIIETGSLLPITASVSLISLTASYVSGSINTDSASYATSASIAISASIANALNPYGNYNIRALTASSAIINGDLTISGSLNASIFSASVIYITSSEIIVGDNIITLNALSPYKRFAGIEMYDSGSGTLSSLLWDAQNDYFFISSSNINGKVISGPNGQLNLTTYKLPKIISGSILNDSNISDDGTTININNILYIKSNSISSSISNIPLTVLTTQSVINNQNNSGSLTLQGRYSGSNINVGIPIDNYPWGNSLTGSFFSTWNNDTNVSDMLRFFAGAFSASYPIPTPNTKTFASVSNTTNNSGSTITINGRIPSGSTNQNILYLQPLGWATIGQTIFNGYTFYNGNTTYLSYASTAGGSTTISSSLGSSAFGLGLLNNSNITTVYLSGSFKLTFSSGSGGIVNYTRSVQTLMSQSVENTSTSISTPIALKIVPSANVAVIPPVYQDGYFSTFTGSNITNSVLLTSVSSSGLYIFSASVGIASGSSQYTIYNATPYSYYYTPLADANFTQTLTSPNSSGSYTTVITRSLSGAPYLTSGSSYRYIVTGSGVFNPLYYNGIDASVTYSNTTLGLTTINSSSLTTNPTIQTAGVVKDSTYTTTRTVGSYPYESDVVVFDLALIAAGTGSNVSTSGSSFSTFTVNTTLYNRAGSGTSVGSQTFNVHTTGTFGLPSASGSLLYFGRPEGYVTSSLTFGSSSLTPGPNTELLLDEANRTVLSSSVLYMSGSNFNSASYLNTYDLQVKPGYLVNPGGTNGYWYPNGYGTTYKYYIRHFKTSVVVNQLRITITGPSSLVNWDSTAANSVAMAIIFESGDANAYARCRIYDINNTSMNSISSSVSLSDLSTNGVNPFSSSIDLYGNNGTGASSNAGVVIFPMRAADGANLDNTNVSQDELYLLIRYNGSPTPITSIKVEKLL